MTMPNAVFAGLVLIAATIYLGHAQNATGQTQPVSPSGPWFLKNTNPNDQVWKMNAATGDLYKCSENKCTFMAAESK
jgi:hypothetical protein